MGPAALEPLRRFAADENPEIRSRAVSGIVEVRKLEDETNAVQQVLDKWGKLDVVIANAGVGKFASIEELEIIA